jgi:uncharacterized membrane protein YdjX (TVP38/TMEM64 family)
VPDLINAVDALGAWAPIGMVVLAILCGLVCLPLAPVVVAIGVLFGGREGLLVAACAVIASGLANFVVARHLWRSVVERRLRRYPRVARLTTALGRTGGRVVALLRLSPVVPWAPVSYAAGLSRMPTRTYALSLLAMMPLTILYASLGALVGRVGPNAWDRVAARLEDIESWAVPLGLVLLLFAVFAAVHAISQSRVTTAWDLSSPPFEKDATP